MIRIYDYNGKPCLINPNQIISVIASGASWHGIKAIVRLTDGTIVEARESVYEIEDKINAEV